MSPPSPVAGDQVVVTATLSAGYVWVSPLPDGWLPGDPAATKATYTVTLDPAPCMPVVPMDPTVAQATCTNGVVTVPTVMPAPSPTGVTYALDPPGPYSRARRTTR